MRGNNGNAEPLQGEVLSVAVPFPPEFVDALAERVADLLGGPATETDGWLRGARHIAEYIACPPSRVYALAECKPPRIPVERDGASLIAKRSELDAWVRSGGGLRP